MPSKKATRKSSTNHSVKAENSRPRRYNDTVQPTDTQLIIVLLLLVFVYPLGLIFMWVWMRHWPTWIKLLISAPLLIGLLSAFFVMLIIRSLLHNPDWIYYHMRQEHQNMMQEKPNNSSPFYLSPSVSPGDNQDSTN